ncbi:metallophosphoesterase [Pseudoflavonifractor phocaeensis]|uniref:metallophosphoesterase n=1 Tax=Pseudoflavonifractor phocaeensis TaxID=1870988 RepID=UPI00210B47D7|nr:metallophosphoesterase [Pseudoflavonifractor phocaeensis]MCQ4863288.1 metallophosphoesterase [Pseudoflavonifractor phocaeensis]
MNILFLHLSDIHMRKSADFSKLRISRLVNSIREVGRFDKCVIIFSGDIANRGEENEYKAATAAIHFLISEIHREYPAKWVDIIVVPGNHDVDLSNGDIGHAGIQKLFRDGNIEKQIENEQQKQKNFFAFAKRVDNLKGLYSPLFNREIISCKDYSIECNLINSAIFSTLDEDKGLHFCPQSIINSLLLEQRKSNISIAILHHAPEWYNDCCKNALERAISARCSIVFLGHEHHPTAKAVRYDKEENTLFLMGGTLSDRENPQKSEYYIGILNTENMDFKINYFDWNDNERIYVRKDITTEKIALKPIVNNGLYINKDYLDQLLEDKRHPGLSKRLSDYFVFPRIEGEFDDEEIKIKEFNNEDEYVKEILKREKIIVSGADNSGKSTLLKHLFYKFSKEKAVIYCTPEEINKRSKEQIVKKAVEEIYGEGEAILSRFRQLPKKDKILFVDDVDQIKKTQFNKFLQEFENDFEYIVMTSKSVVELDVVERARQALGTEINVQKYHITRVNADKRREIVKKVITLKTQLAILDIPNEQIEINICDGLNAQKTIMTLNPDFIIQYVEYYVRNIHSIKHSDAEIFSKVFEANLTFSLDQNTVKGIRVEKASMILEMIALFIHFNKKYPITFNELNEIVKEYNDIYNSDVVTPNFITMVENARILEESKENGTYKFCNKNYLAYFVAKGIIREHKDTGNDEKLKEILKLSCFDINADVLLFIVYLEDNRNTVQTILDWCNQVMGDWKEFKTNKVNIPYLSNMSDWELPEPTKDEKEEESKKEVEHEKEYLGEEKYETIDIYDYCDEEINTLFNKIQRSISILTVVARCLPIFEHMMPRALKADFIEAIYKLPNKIFYLWASEVEKNKDDLIQLLDELQENEFNRQKKTPTQLMAMLQWHSMSLLLELYLSTMRYAAKENTIKFLEEYSFVADETFEIEHLMALEKSKMYEDFITTANKIFDNTKENINKIMVRRVIYHIIMNDEGLSQRNLQKLQSRYFPKSKAGILLARSKKIEK